MNDVNRRYHANRDTVAIAHHDEGRMRILVRQNLNDGYGAHHVTA
jgi:hypothetical protein